MAWLRRLMDKWQPLFLKGGPYEKYFVVYEMLDGFLFTPATVTRSAPHVKDGADLKRVMMYVFVAVLPCIGMALYNTGFQANMAMATLGLDAAPGWRGAILAFLGVGYAPSTLSACVWHGFLYFFPIYVVTLLAGGFWEVLFAAVRNHEVNEGFLVTSILFVLTLPPNVPLWQVALGISFGVVLGKEVFGGTGKNFLNPALTGRAFLFFAFPAQMSGNAIWTAVDGYSGATALGLAALGGLPALQEAGLTWGQSFLGHLQGSMGESSTIACLIGAAFLIYTRVASWRIMAGVAIGMVGTTMIFNLFGDSANPMVTIPWYWHLVMGGAAFGMVFMATDPVSASMTTVGRWIFGMLIGFMTILIRVANPAFPEGMMLAILFANIFAPLIDYCVIQANIRKRMVRNAV